MTNDSNGHPAPTTYATLSPGQWPPDPKVFGLRLSWLARLYTPVFDWFDMRRKAATDRSWQESYQQWRMRQVVADAVSVNGIGVPAQADLPDLPHFCSEVTSSFRAATPPASPVAGRPAAKREPGDHTCMIACLIPGSEDRWYILTAGPDGGRDFDLGPGRYRGLGGTARFVGHQGSDCWMGPKRDAARKFSCPGAAADWFAARCEAFVGLSGFAIIHATTGDVIIELTEEVVGGTSGGMSS